MKEDNYLNQFSQVVLNNISQFDDFIELVEFSITTFYKNIKKMD